jgi:Response regulator containing CheY-like receiver domain and AraC-type DNA-binding domain
LLGIINRVCKENGTQLSEIYSGNITPNELLISMDTLEEIEEWIQGLFTKLVEIKDTKEGESYSAYVNKTISYIKTHYSENISLSIIAEDICVNSSYLSTLFKEETGTGFSEYLCDIRLEKAKALLEEGKLEMKEIISMCGFNNYAYFFSIFKKEGWCNSKGIYEESLIRVLSGTKAFAQGYKCF